MGERPSGLQDMVYSATRRKGSSSYTNQSGLSVQLQTLLLQHHLSVITNRSLAYEPINMRRPKSFLTSLLLSNSRSRSSQIPVSAFISSLSSGFESLYDASPATPLRASRAVRSACSKGKAQVVDFNTPFNPDGTVVPEEEGQKLMHQLQLEVAAKSSACVWVKGHVLDYS